MPLDDMRRIIWRRCGASGRISGTVRSAGLRFHRAPLLGRLISSRQTNLSITLGGLAINPLKKRDNIALSIAL
jgi:hypothetical protein